MAGLSEGTGAKEWRTEMVLIFLSRFITIINLILIHYNIKFKLKPLLFRRFKQTITTNQKRMIFRMKPNSSRTKKLPETPASQKPLCAAFQVAFFKIGSGSGAD